MASMLEYEDPVAFIRTDPDKMNSPYVLSFQCARIESHPHCTEMFRRL
jgi:hypothetical protein